MIGRRLSKFSIVGLFVAAALTAGHAALAQQTDVAPSGKPVELAEVVVTATTSRIPGNLGSVPASVTIIDAEEIARQTKFSSDLGELLQNTVPGLGVSSSGSYSNFNQTLRGRKPAVFIDGVPATVPLRDGGRDLRLISPEVIGRIDVVRGATAIYGLGAAGGVINYATREPAAGPPEFLTNVSFGGSVTHPDDSLNWSLDQSVSGKVDRVSFLASGYYEGYQSLFDASGDRIPPDPQFQGGIADTHTYDVYGKLGFDLTDSQRVFLSTNLYRTGQDTGYSAGLGVFGSVPTPAVKVTPPGGNQFTRSSMTILRYVNDDLFLDSPLNVSGYYDQYDARYAFFDFPVYPPNGGQSQIVSRRWGVRSDVNTPLHFALGTGSVLWGIDYTHDNSSQKMVDGRTLVPQLVDNSYAPFAQLQFPIGAGLSLLGGARYDHTTIAVGTFTTIPIYDVYLPGGVTVQGGSVGYSKLFGNAGIVTSPIQSGWLRGASFYTAFSQGYSVGDFGRALRSTTASSVSTFNFQPDTVNSYEIGMRTAYGTTKGQFAVYYSTSTFGSTFNNVTFENIRAPERIWGLELSLDGEPAPDWRWGSSVSWVNGETQEATTGVWSPLDTSRIPPAKLTTYLEHSIAGQWHVRGQYLYSSFQHRFRGNPAVSGEADVAAYGLVDVSVGRKVGPGELTFAADNILNEKYITPDAYRDAVNDEYTTGPGAMLRVSYSVKY